MDVVLTGPAKQVTSGITTMTYRTAVNNNIRIIKLYFVELAPLALALNLLPDWAALRIRLTRALAMTLVTGPLS